MNRRIRKIAAHHLLLPDGTTCGRSLVEINSSGRVTRWCPLNREEPQTEWLGGSIRLCKGDDGTLLAYHNGQIMTCE